MIEKLEMRIFRIHIYTIIDIFFYNGSINSTYIISNANNQKFNN